MIKKLRLPVALAVVVLSGCGDDSSPPADAATPDTGTTSDAAMADAAPPADAGLRDAAMADAGPDAGCEVFEQYNPDTMMCEPVA